MPSLLQPRTVSLSVALRMHLRVACWDTSGAANRVMNSFPAVFCSRPLSSYGIVLQVLVSLAAVAAFALVGIPLIGHFSGIAGIVKFWLMPWLGYHFWMSTFTVVHHTAPHIPFKPAGEWNAAKAQLSGTVHCDYPRWCAPSDACAKCACAYPA